MKVVDLMYSMVVRGTKQALIFLNLALYSLQNEQVDILISKNQAL